MALKDEQRAPEQEENGGTCMATVSSVGASTLPTHDHTLNSNHLSGTSSHAATRPSHGEESTAQDMELSPIQVRKAMLTQSLQNESADQRGLSVPSTQDNKVGVDGEAGPEAVDASRTDLSSKFSQTLRLGPLDRSIHEANAAATTIGSKISDVVVMPPGLPRDIKPGTDHADELSVLSAGDDLSVLFMEARESAIRRGLDQPAALPRTGTVADRTKALLQQMGSKRNNSTTNKGT